MVKPCAVVVGWRAGDARRAGDRPIFASGPAGLRASCSSTTRRRRSRTRSEVVLPLPENRGYAGGANAGWSARSPTPRSTHVVVMNDDIELAPGALRLLAEACGDDGCASPMIEAPGADAFAGGRIDARGFGRHEPGARDFLTGAALCLPRARGSASARSTSACSSTTRTSSGACAPVPPASRCASSRDGDRTPRGRALDRWRRRRDLGLLLDAQPPLAPAAHARPRRRRDARRANTVGARAAPRARAGRAREAARRARLGRGTDGPGALPAVRVAFDGVVFTQSRAGSARVAQGILDALPARRARDRARAARRRRLLRPRQRAPEGGGAAPGPRLVRRRARARGAPRAAPTCCTARPSARRCARRACRSSRPSTTSRCCASPAGSPPGAARYGRHLMPRAIRLADRVVCVSHATARDVAGLLGVPDARLRVVPNGIDALFSEPAAIAPGRGPVHPLRRHAGAAQEPRAPRRRRRVAAGARAGPSGSCSPAPTAGATSSCRRASASSRSAGSPTTRCATCYAHAGCVAYPSLWEGFGLVAGEALAAGCPVVASDIPALREVAGDDAEYCDPRSVESIAAALRARARRAASGAAPHADLGVRGVARSPTCGGSSRREHATARADRRRHGRSRPHRRRVVHRQPAARAARGRARSARSRRACATPMPCRTTSRPPCAGSRCTVASPYRRIPFSLPQLARREGAALLHVQYFVAPRVSDPDRRDGARPQLHAPARAVRAARPPAARRARAGLGATCPARDRRLGVHTRTT